MYELNIASLHNVNIVLLEKLLPVARPACRIINQIAFKGWKSKEIKLFIMKKIIQIIEISLRLIN